jgi:hypothetical protein
MKLLNQIVRQRPKIVLPVLETTSTPLDLQTVNKPTRNVQRKPRMKEAHTLHIKRRDGIHPKEQSGKDPGQEHVLRKND